MPKSVSLKGVAVGVLFLFAAYFAARWLFDETFPLAPLWAKLTAGALWHCVVMLLIVPLAAGYVAGRVAGHDHELNGALTGSSLSLYIAALVFLDENVRFEFALISGFILSLVVNPMAGYMGGQLSAGINPLSPRSPEDAAALAERRRQKKAAAQRGYKLVVLNDEHTPMPFIVDILKRFFAMEHAAALATMLHIREHGRAIAAIYEHSDTAQTKLADVTAFITKTGQALRCAVEEPTH